MPFHPERVVVEAVDDVEWRVVEPFSYEGNLQCFTVARGMQTDFASVPRIFVWFLPRYGKYTLAAILHDHLWRHVAPKDIRFVDADGIFRRAMRELGVPFLRRWIMWAAVRWGALVKGSQGRTGWIGEAPRVFLVTMLALPFLLPAGLMVALSLAAFQAVELLAYLPLRSVEASRRTRGRAAGKQVNPPRVEWSA